LSQRLLLLFLALLFTSCSLKEPKVTVSLSSYLENLGAPKNEALLIQKEAIEQTLKLKKSYGSSFNPRFHNLLVNLNLSKRGLCWHYAHDLYGHLSSFVNELDMIIVVANKDSLLEHSAVVLTCKGCDIEEGMVLDAWRDKKKLFYILTKEDSYKWSKR